jgi:hypothetical protein
MLRINIHEQLSIFVLIFSGLSALCSRLRFHDSGQCIPHAPARYQDEGGEHEHDAEGEGGGSEYADLEDHHAGAHQTLWS